LAADLSVTGLDVNGSSLRLQTTGLTDTTAPAVLTGLASQGMAAQWTNGQINIEFSGAQP
jgi:hypothetical protein